MYRTYMIPMLYDSAFLYWSGFSATLMVSAMRNVPVNPYGRKLFKTVHQSASGYRKGCAGPMSRSSPESIDIMVGYSSLVLTRISGANTHACRKAIASDAYASHDASLKFLTTCIITKSIPTTISFQYPSHPPRASGPKIVLSASCAESTMVGMYRIRFTSWTHRKIVLPQLPASSYPTPL